MVKKITELEKAMTAPMAPMATRDYMAAMQHAAMQQVREDIRRKKICFCFAKILSNIFQTSAQAAMANIGNVGAIQQVKFFQLFLHFYSGCHGPGQHGYEQHWWHAAGKT
jgi:hypothetical protein